MPQTMPWSRDILPGMFLTPSVLFNYKRADLLHIYNYLKLFILHGGIDLCRSFSSALTMTNHLRGGLRKEDVPLIDGSSHLNFHPSVHQGLLFLESSLLPFVDLTLQMPCQGCHQLYSSCPKASYGSKVQRLKWKPWETSRPLPGEAQSSTENNQQLIEDKCLQDIVIEHFLCVHMVREHL